MAICYVYGYTKGFQILASPPPALYPNSTCFHTEEESWGDSIHLVESSGEGTHFEILLSHWEVSKIQINEGQTVIVLDDDEIVHSL